MLKYFSKEHGRPKIENEDEYNRWDIAYQLDVTAADNAQREVVTGSPVAHDDADDIVLGDVTPQLGHVVARGVGRQPRQALGQPHHRTRAEWASTERDLCSHGRIDGPQLRPPAAVARSE